MKTDDVIFNAIKELDDLPSVAPPQDFKKLMILSTPRSGSSLFCDVLNQTGMIGRCTEWFNLRYIKAYGKLRQRQNIDFTAYIRFLVEKSVQGTGVFAVNMHIENYIRLLKSDVDPLKLVNFDHFIYIKRGDKIAQAVSLALALKTDRWSADATTQPGSDATPEFEEITKALLRLIQAEKRYRMQFRPRVAAEFQYEEFSDLDKPGSFIKLFNLLGIDLEPDQTFASNMQIMRTDKTKNLAKTYSDFIHGISQ